MTVSVEQIQRIAGFELNALRLSGALGEEFEKVRIPKRGTTIYDLNGAVLFYRIPLRRGQIASGYVDIAADEAFGEPLLATSMGLAWDEKALLETGTARVLEVWPQLKYDAVRFVAYSFPKIALQFLLRRKEVLMLELFSWVEIPPKPPEPRKQLEPSNFERWSLLDELPENVKRTRVRNFRERLELSNLPALQMIDLSVIMKEKLQIRDIVIKLFDTWEIHYSQRQNDHYTCYELRSQQTPVWCVAASVEMVLNFYRYSYDQVRIAQELDLGTCAMPNGLPYSRVGDVVTVMENLTSNALDVTMHTNPTWNIFHSEISANRPMISFIPGHSRSVAGYTHSLLNFPGQVPYRGLLVYDPWPPPATNCTDPEVGGVITRWENFATQTYQFAYSSVLRQV